MDNNVKKFTQQGKTKLVKGTILTPEMSGLRMIMAAADETGQPTDPLYDLLDTKWKNAKAELKGWHQYHWDFKLGNIKETAVNSDIWIMHCLFMDKKGVINEAALASCLKKLGEKAKYERASVHVTMDLVQRVPGLDKLLLSNLVENGVSVYFYEQVKKK